MGSKQDRVDDAASDWAARLGGGPLDDDARRRLGRWLGQDTSHGAALDEALAAWRLMGAVGRDPGDLMQDVVAPSSVVFGRFGKGLRSSRTWARGGAGALAASLLLAVLWGWQAMPMLGADYRTGIAEQRNVSLPDGSVVTLGPDSAIALRYDDYRRQVDLLAGIAYFTAAPRGGDERRPFVVAAGDGEAQALGTQFMVNRLDGAVEVVVAEHEVEVTAGGEHVFLSPGQGTRYGRNGVDRSAVVGVDLATAWRTGTLVFDHRPLGEVVEQLNRYRRDRIVIVDKDLEGRMVSGVFETADPDATLRTISKVLEINTVSVPPMVTILY